MKALPSMPHAPPPIPRGLGGHPGGGGVKTIFFVRHGESKWNAAKRGHNVYKMVREHDHPLNETGYRQALSLQTALRNALAASSAASSSNGSGGNNGAGASAAQLMAGAEAYWASPLTRALQTAIVGLSPILSQPGKTLELKLNAREKKNFGGLDSIGRVCGAQCYPRALAELRALDANDGGPTASELMDLSRLQVDPTEVEEEWWNEGAEDSESLTSRLDVRRERASNPAVFAARLWKDQRPDWSFLRDSDERLFFASLWCVAGANAPGRARRRRAHHHGGPLALFPLRLPPLPPPRLLSRRRRARTHPAVQVRAKLHRARVRL